MTAARLYAVVDQVTAARRGWRPPALARACLAGGARLIQLRVTAAPSGQALDWCDEIVADARRCGARVVMNDRADVALLAGAAGVHVGQTDLGVDAVRRVLPPSAVVGISTHAAGEVDRSLGERPAYVAVGPVYATRTKAAGCAPVGLDLVRYAARVQPRPVVAIGGVTLERARDLVGAGASAVAVVSDLLRGGGPERRVAAYVELLAALPVRQSIDQAVPTMIRPIATGQIQRTRNVQARGAGNQAPWSRSSA